MDMGRRTYNVSTVSVVDYQNGSRWLHWTGLVGSILVGPGLVITIGTLAVRGELASLQASVASSQNSSISRTAGAVVHAGDLVDSYRRAMWAGADSNRRPPRCKRGILTARLPARRAWVTRRRTWACR
jgi:hypothetical protein